MRKIIQTLSLLPENIAWLKENTVNMSAFIDNFLSMKREESIKIENTSKIFNEELEVIKMENTAKSEMAYNLWYEQQREKERLLMEQDKIGLQKELDEMKAEYNHYLDLGQEEEAQKVKEKMIEKSKGSKK